jgi:ATP synthase protein I
MKADLALPGKKLAAKGIIVQLIVGLIMILISVFVLSVGWVSVTLGVIAFLIPHSIFAYWVFRYAGATKNHIVAQSLNQGMKLKLILTILIFVISFSVFKAQLLPLLGAYVITMVSQWTAIYRFSKDF